jgi:hypothetical protein
MPDDKIEKLDEDLISGRIYSIRGFQVMLDRDLAELYGVEIRVLNQVVKRNIMRFPVEFCFQLNESEYKELKSNIDIKNRLKNPLRSQIVIIENAKGRHTKYLPYVYTEQGVAMLAGVLKSEIAVNISIRIIKAFVAMRKFIQSNAQMFQRLDRVELKQIETYSRLDENDKKFDKIFSLMESGDMKANAGNFL